MVNVKQYQRQEKDRKKLFKELSNSKKKYLTDIELTNLFDEAKQKNMKLSYSDYVLLKYNPFTYNEARKLLKLQSTLPEFYRNIKKSKKKHKIKL